MDFVFQVSAGCASLAMKLACIFSDFLARDGCICFLGAAKLILQDVCTVLGAFG